MSVPIIKSLNTIGIKYVQGTRNNDHYEQIIEKLLGVSGDELVGLDDRGPNRFIFKVSTDERYNQICADFLGRTLIVEPGSVVKVEDYSAYANRPRTFAVSAAALIMGDAAENGGESGDRNSQGSEVACDHPSGDAGDQSSQGSEVACDQLRGPDGGTIIIRSDIKTDNEMMAMTEFAKWMYEATGVMGFIQEWHSLKFYTINSLKDLEVVLNSGIEYEKTHELRARCTVFFTRVDKDLLVRIKNETENVSLRKKAEEDSGVTIEDVRHIGLGRTIRVHCLTPTGAETIIKNGLSIGGITLRKGKLEELKPIVQCTHCWKVDHKNRNCALSQSKEPPVCGTCGKTGHRRKNCPTPNDQKCVLCDGKHSSSAARCLVRQAKIEEAIRFQKEFLTNISTPPHQSVSLSVQVGSTVDASQQTVSAVSLSALQREASQLADADTAAVFAILANATATITSAPPCDTEPDAGDELHAAIAAAFRPVFDSFDIVKIIGDTAWRRARGSRETFLEHYKEYLRQNDMPVPKFDSLLED